MKVKIAQDLSDITLLQFQKYDLYLQGEPDLLLKIQIFTGIDRDKLATVPLIDLQELELLIDKALVTETPFKDRFYIEDIEFGFIPNLDKMTFGEFKNLNDYDGSVEDMHKTMAILFRPIQKKFSFRKTKLYTIEPYNGTDKYAEIMKLMPLNVVTGALFFFVNLSKELLTHTQKYIIQAQQREEQQAIISKNGDGMQPSMN